MVARLFTLTRPALMRLDWFAAMHGHWTRWKTALLERVRDHIPTNHNPFHHYDKSIISIDTLKQDQFVAHLRRHRWDAVVIDESHNITNSATQNNGHKRTRFWDLLRGQGHG